MKYLDNMEKRVRVAVRDAYGDTSLNLAAKNGYKTVVQLLES